MGGDSFRLDGKAVLVTGANGGIGRAICEIFRGAGADVIEADLASEVGNDPAFQPLDVASDAGWDEALASVVARLGRIDVLVNGAGIFRPSVIEDETAASFLRHVEVNQLGVFLGMRAVLPSMKASGGGSIVNISSAAGLIGTPGTISYTATKWAVRGMTKAAAVELAPFGIRVNSIHPGPVDTPMVTSLPGSENAGKGAPMRRMATPAEVARMALFLASPASSYSTGSEFICDGGISAG